MRPITRHLSQCFLAGALTLLPAVGLVLTVASLESSIAGSWLARQPFYFPGLGLVLTAATVYLVGLAVSTLLGRWLWARLDTILDRLPLLGQLYQTAKQVLGSGHGKEAMFQRAVLVASGEGGGEEVGLVTGEIPDAGGGRKLTVFIPGSPNPTNGRLLILDARATRPLNLPVNEALKAIVSLGKMPLSLPPDKS